MHPVLFDFHGLTIYSYGVLLAASYLLGLQFALIRARRRGLDGQRVMDLGIWIIVSALVAISLYARQLGNDEKLSRYGLALILGGAFGNLIDRAIAGYVVDFVDVYWGEAHFWAFNVADAAITIGAVLVLLEMLGVGRHHASRPV